MIDSQTRTFLRFRFRTAYLSVTYIDRFLSKGLINSDKHWAIRLLSVACLSLAAKMEESNAPALTEFPTDEYTFDSSVIQRMELLVLTTLDWRMHSITPFDFIRCFISCFCTESSKRHFVSRTTQILFATIKGKYKFNGTSFIYRSNGSYIDGHGSKFDKRIFGD
ncbi:Cyclin-like protein [Cynara cardunculus var. scolymus]|uniref:Cyclin-like protein n=1 Tax=Cynara cardunculus var. scolymus TaxID=59895 RepID=A0A103XYZ2_CYNCS|nr:Cyclin-like protein [Cynara cardunculus var. scolymus]